MDLHLKPMDHLTDVRWDRSMTTTATVLTIAAALGSAIFGGAMYAFSAFVMHALDRTPTRSAVEAMQQINLSAPRPPLVLVMVGTTVLSLGLIVVSTVDLFSGDATGSTWLALAGCAGFLASMAITGGFHIPRNNALATVTADGPDAAAAWAAYSGPWQRGNHVRATAALGGALLLILSLIA
jgi:uncharacterized membrane protein